MAPREMCPVKLVIVESPAKAKTIEKFLGPDYRVVASYGHIRDLPESASDVPEEIRDKEWAKWGVDTEGDFRPYYVVPSASRKHVNRLRKELRKAEEVILATDEDREGESISWHLLEVLEPDVPVRRIAFHEITRPAIREALEHPRDVDEQLVRAQETRRILDRLYGYSLSPVLWKKVRGKLSAGRVQSVAVRLVVEREEERQAFTSTEYWDVDAVFPVEDGEFTASLVIVDGRRLASSRDFDSTTGVFDESSGARILTGDEARAIAEGAASALPWRVSAVERKETRQSPSAPFITSTLQQTASSRLRFSPKKTMMLAQRLYEGVDLGGGDREGLITYMRTDSVALSGKAMGDAGRWINGRFGEEWHQPRRYRTKAKGAQEAHEAIRPSEISRTPEQVARFLEADARALYELVWRRTVASQMSDAVLDRTTLDLEAEIDGRPHVFRATGSVLRFPGFLEVYGSRREDTLLPRLEEGESVGVREEVTIEPKQHETRPPPRYTEASLVKKLEEEGIGRPSTYQPTLSTIQDREYVVKKGSQLVPTYVGMAVTHLLREHFADYVDVSFTARMEDRLDQIASGEIDWVEALARFWRGEENGGTGLREKIEEELPRIEYPSIPVGRDPETGSEVEVRIGRNYVYIQRGEGDDPADRATIPVDLLIDELTPERVRDLLTQRARAEEPLGTDPDSGENVYVKSGPYGPYVQLGETEDGEKPKRTSVPDGVDPAEVDLDYALRLLSLPRAVGTDPESGKEVVADLGRYGPYVRRVRTYANVGSVDRLFDITLEEALELIEQKEKKGGKRVIREVGEHPETGIPLQVLDGRYGPYVTDGKTNASVPKGEDPETVTLDRALALLEERASKGKKGRRGGRKRKKKS